MGNWQYIRITNYTVRPTNPYARDISLLARTNVRHFLCEFIFSQVASTVLQCALLSFPYSYQLQETVRSFTSTLGREELLPAATHMLHAADLAALAVLAVLADLTVHHTVGIHLRKAAVVLEPANTHYIPAALEAGIALANVLDSHTETGLEVD